MGRTRFMNAVTSALAILLLGQVGSHASAASTYTITSIGSVGKGLHALAKNNRSQVVGYELPGSPFFMTGGTVYFPPVPSAQPLSGATCWRLTDINDSANIAGYVWQGPGCTGQTAAFTGYLKGSSLTTTFLGNASGGFFDCQAYTINDAGVVAGTCDKGFQGPDEVFWPRKKKTAAYLHASQLHYPGKVHGFPSPYAKITNHIRSIDQFGEVLASGYYMKPTTMVGVFFTTAHKGVTLPRCGTGGSPIVGRPSGWAESLWSSGDRSNHVTLAVGWCNINSAGDQAPCVWRVAVHDGKTVVGHPQILGKKAQSNLGAAVDIAGGEIVGHFSDATGTPAVWLSHKPLGAKDKWHGWNLNNIADPDWTVSDSPDGPTALNDHDDIAVAGSYDHQPTGFDCHICARYVGTGR